MFIESDIATSEFGEAIMVHPPNYKSDLTFDEWLHASLLSNKGLKLDFKKQNVIENCVKKIVLMEKDIKVPIMLNADILQSDLHAPKPIIDADFFLNTCKSYSDAIISPGWTTINSSTLSYTWLNVFEMFNLINKYNLKQITLPVRANWALKSINHLHWLIQHTNSTLTVWGHETDEFTSNESILLLRKYFPSTIVFYDLPTKTRNYLNENLENYDEILQNSNDILVSQYLKSTNFKLNLWQSNSQVFLSDHGGVMNGFGAFLRTSKQFKAVESESIIYELSGKFEIFKNVEIKQANNEDQLNELIIDRILADQTSSVSGANIDCIKISLRSSNSVKNEERSGSVVVYYFLNGIVKLEVNNKVVQEGNLYSKSSLFEFLITDVGENKNIHIDLINYDLNMNKYSLQFLVNSKYYDKQNFFVKIQLLSSIYAVGIESLKLSDEISDPQDNIENSNY